MDTRIAEKWVDALRSEKYQQGTGCLKQTKNQQDKFCCLGVLADIAIKEGLKINVKQLYERTIFGDRGDYLPTEVQKWANMKTPSGYFTKDNITNTLSYINDGGTKFDEIATIIEDNIEEL